MMVPARHGRTAWIGWWAAMWLAVLAVMPAAAAPTFPPFAGHVTDAANVLPEATRTALEARLAELERTTGTELAVATVADLEGYEIDDYANGLFRAWGIGKKDRNSGVLLLVAPNQRRVRVEVGYGLEGDITDALSGRIIRREIVPRFKAGDLPGGIVAGADALIGHLQLPADQRAAALAAAGDGAGNRSAGSGFSTIVWLVIIIVFVFAANGGGKRGRRRGPVVIWGPGIGGSWGGSGGGGDWGGGGGGGGGFGGFGGGSSGGGGASGDW